MRATGVGSMPGSDAKAYTEATRVVLDLLATDGGVPFVVELPGRGATAQMSGRSLAVVDGLGADLQPAGWRLTDAPGLDQRRARSLLAQDLDQVEELAQEYVGPFKTQIAGPWTLSATVEKPRGDKVLSDHGARRELAQALAEGLGSHISDLRRRLPGVERLIVQVDEPALAAVRTAQVPTASGFGRHRSVNLPELSAALELVFAAITAAGAEPWLHSCARDTPWALVHDAGARGLSGDLAVLGAADYEPFAAALDRGDVVALGVVPTLEPSVPPTDRAPVEAALRWLEMLGLDLEEVAERLFLTPACGLAGAGPAWAVSALRLVGSAARQAG